MDYKNGKVYVIRNVVNDKVYVGSTTQILSKRFHKHKHQINCQRHKNYPLYVAMREIGVENFYIELIENFPCNSKEELHAREGHYIREFNSYKEGYNALVSGRDKQQYYQEEKEYVNQHNKENYEKNKEERLKKNKEYYEKNKETILKQQKEHYEENKEKYHKKQAEYREKNRELIRQRDNERRSKNKDEINKKRREDMTTCNECGHTYPKHNHSYHLKSKKHLDYINNKINNI